MKKWLAACMALLIFAGSAAAAVRVTDLYDVETPVNGQDATERTQVLHDALLEVFTRLAGSRNFEQFPPLKDALDHAASYVQQYRYRQLPDLSAASGPAPGAAPAVATPSAPAAPQQALWVRFDAAAVERVLRNSGLAVWGVERPQTLVWFAVEDGADRHLIGVDTRDPVRDALEAEAKRRGVPLMFPLLDVEDRSRVRFADVWGGFTDTLQSAAARYSPEALLTVRLLHDGDTWNARWTLDNQSHENTWTTSGADLTTVLQSGVDGLADMLASRYAVQIGQQDVSDVRLHVSGVHGAADYARVNHYLGTLAAVDQATLAEVTPEQLVYSVRVHGAASVLERSLALGNVLVPGSPPAQPAPAATPVPAAEAETASAGAPGAASPPPGAPDAKAAVPPAPSASSSGTEATVSTPTPASDAGVSAMQDLYYRLVQ